VPKKFGVSVNFSHFLHVFRVSCKSEQVLAYYTVTMRPSPAALDETWREARRRFGSGETVSKVAASIGKSRHFVYLAIGNDVAPSRRTRRPRRRRNKRSASVYGQGLTIQEHGAAEFLLFPGFLPRREWRSWWAERLVR